MFFYAGSIAVPPIRSVEVSPELLSLGSDKRGKNRIEKEKNGGILRDEVAMEVHDVGAGKSVRRLQGPKEFDR